MSFHVHVGKTPISGKIETDVRYEIEVDGLVHTITVNTWVEDCDSRSELYERAKQSAASLLSLAVDQEPD
jgi:hypothetical protein